VAALALNNQFPGPPTNVEKTALSKSMELRLREVRDGGPLCVTAYLIFTDLKKEFVEVSRVTARYKISNNALKRLRCLSNKAHPFHERKKWEKQEGLTDDEIQWLKEKCEEVACRVIDIESGCDLQGFKEITI
jgi:hypothetical protein